MNNRDFRRELEERERLANISKERERGRGRITDKEKEEVDKPPKRLKLEQNLDADDPLDESDAGDSDSDSDDDETAALMAELQKIKREKAAEEKEKVLVKWFLLIYYLQIFHQIGHFGQYSGQVRRIEFFHFCQHFINNLVFVYQFVLTSLSINIFHLLFWCIV